MKIDKEFSENENGILRIIYIVVVVSFTVVSIRLLPFDFYSFEISLYPGVGVFFWLIVFVIVVKFVCIIDWYIIIIFANKKLSLVIQIIGTITIGISFLVTLAAIYIVMRGNKFALIIESIITHPFVVDFAFFIVCNILTYVVLLNKSFEEKKYAAIQTIPMNQFDNRTDQLYITTKFPSTPYYRG